MHFFFNMPFSVSCWSDLLQNIHFRLSYAVQEASFHTYTHTCTNTKKKVCLGLGDSQASDTNKTLGYFMVIVLDSSIMEV